MAGDWIKVEKSTICKPEVLQVSQILGIHPLHALGLCVKFWAWADDQLINGNARGVTKVTLDFVIGHDGFTDALVKVDWLRDRNGALEVPRFDRHLSEGAKNRALTKERVRKSKEKSNGKSVTKVTVKALPEKRREEKRVSTEEGVPSSVVTTQKPKSVFWSVTDGWHVPEEELKRLGEAYPAVSITALLKRSDAWLRANPAKARKKQWLRFLTNWIAREQERGGDLKSNKPAKHDDPEVAAWRQHHKEESKKYGF